MEIKLEEKTKNNKKMNFKQAFSWLSQPGIKAIMPIDKDTRDALEIAMQALKKQIPMEVTKIQVDKYYCPACGSENLCGELKVTDNYCPMCGQKIYQKNWVTINQSSCG